jgi:hypothetical protein
MMKFSMEGNVFAGQQTSQDLNCFPHGRQGFAPVNANFTR